MLMKRIYNHCRGSWCFGIAWSWSAGIDNKGRVHCSEEVVPPVVAIPPDARSCFGVERPVAQLNGSDVGSIHHSGHKGRLFFPVKY